MLSVVIYLLLICYIVMLSVVILNVIMLSVMAPPHLPQRAKSTYESAEAKGVHFEEDKVDNLKSSFKS
jgi:hypothetical protein